MLEVRLAELNSELDGLRARLIPEIGRRHVPDAKIVWKARALYQCVLRRSLELIDGTSRAWAHQEHLTAVLLARALMETAVFTWDITDGIDDGLQRADWDAINRLLNDRWFATRVPDMLEEGMPKAENVLTLIDRLDRDMLRASGQKPIEGEQVMRRHYSLLSDFSHPNRLGVAVLFGELDEPSEMFRFRVSEAARVRLSHTLGVSMTSVTIVERCLRKLDLLIEPLREMNTKRRITHPAE